jgi:hypothetical protein
VTCEWSGGDEASEGLLRCDGCSITSFFNAGQRIDVTGGKYTIILHVGNSIDGRSDTLIVGDRCHCTVCGKVGN